MDLSTLLDCVRSTFYAIPNTAGDYETRVKTAVEAHLFRNPDVPDTEVCVPSVILREILAQGSTAAKEMYSLLTHCLMINALPGALLLHSMYATVADSALPGCTCKAFLSNQLKDAPRDRYLQLVGFDQYWNEHGNHVLAQMQTTTDLQMLLINYSPIFLLFNPR